MRIRTLHKTILFYIFVVVAILLALEVYPPQKVNGKDSQEFSAQRVAHDIRVISKEPHSIQHPKERKVLRDYLFYRLKQMGGNTQIIEYDSIPSKLGGKFNYANIYSVFNPDNSLNQVVNSRESIEGENFRQPDSYYVLLVAHYDSRFRQKVLGDTVFSYGAADDGYGLGVILEGLSQALNYRHEWKQGIKVLFTDAEEHELDGMRSAALQNPEIFHNVNLVINIEARGVRGPALLFETSAGNEKIMNLYKLARRPAGFSLTTAVYRYMPNDTDFSVIKDSIPGINMAVIDNLDFYHTDRDNYSNISLQSIQHYGDQLMPILYEYLTGKGYNSKEVFISDSDVIFFALPVVGLVTFTKWNYLIVNMVVYLLFLLVAFIYVYYNRLMVKELLKRLKSTLLFAIGAAAAGFLAAYVASVHIGTEFSVTDLKYIPYADTLAIVMCSVLTLWILIHYRLHERRDKFFAWKMQLGANILLMILSILLYIAFGENFFVLIPLAISSLAMLLSISRYFKWMYLLSSAFTLFMGFYFLKQLYIAITLGSLGIELFLAAVYASSVISQYYCFKREAL